jgi:hypothetical protein
MRQPPPSRWPELYRGGMSLQQLATASGHTYAHVRKSLLADGVTMRPASRPPGEWRAHKPKVQP